MSVNKYLQIYKFMKQRVLKQFQLCVKPDQICGYMRRQLKPIKSNVKNMELITLNLFCMLEVNHQFLNVYITRLCITVRFNFETGFVYIPGKPIGFKKQF
ncbi:Hypothetical_protein [Hexamita inflata]|uniref:Hypothetical_protein n=1 Tax=Hexamita inflata TaxID=28002 RepID=A0AA86QEK8_9EUKA|nr:Hypothetical protein HINF_LOCUS42462 [Hexamita inflata]